MSDRLAVFNRGRIEQVGSPAERLRAAGDAVRRRLRRDVEPAQRRGRANDPRPGRHVHRPAREDPPRRARRPARRRRDRGGGAHLERRLSRTRHPLHRRARRRGRARRDPAEPGDVLDRGARPGRQDCPPRLEVGSTPSPSAAAGTRSAAPDVPARREEEHGQAEDRRGARRHGARVAARVRAAVAGRQHPACRRRSAMARAR